MYFRYIDVAQCHEYVVKCYITSMDSTPHSTNDHDNKSSMIILEFYSILQALSLNGTMGGVGLRRLFRRLFRTLSAVFLMGLLHRIYIITYAWDSGPEIASSRDTYPYPFPMEWEEPAYRVIHNDQIQIVEARRPVPHDPRSTDPRQKSRIQMITLSQIYMYRREFQDDKLPLNPSKVRTTPPLPLVERVDDNHKRKPYLFVSTFGRMGNHLFEYAALFAVAMATNRTAVLYPEITDLMDLFPDIQHPIMESPWSSIALHRINERNAGVFQPRVFNISASNADYELCCFLQSWKYFANHESELRQQLQFSDHLQKYAADLIRSLKAEYMRKTAEGSEIFIKEHEVTVIGVHIRRQDVAELEQTKRGYKPAPMSYINKAMGYYRQKHNHTLFLVFSDEFRWCMRRFPKDRPDIMLMAPRDKDFVTLAHCDHSIMTVGTYGWWASWLAGGEVIYYKNWPTPGSEIAYAYSQPEDYFPPHWVGLE